MHVLHIIALELRTIMTGWGEKKQEMGMEAHTYNLRTLGTSAENTVS